MTGPVPRVQRPQYAGLADAANHLCGRARNLYGVTTQLTMRRAPKLSEFPRYPVTAGTAAIALGVTIAWWAKADISPLLETAMIRRGELWRLLTSIFPHLDVMHLAFNIYWLWVFGTLVEEVYGHLKTAALVILFALGSNSLEFAFLQGGVGLSGVGYGLFGMLWMLSRRDGRFREAVDDKTVLLFLAWFVFCIVTTATHIFSVANIAHGVGAILGVLVGIGITLPPHRIPAAAGAGAILLFGLLGATFARPFVNLSSRSGYEEAKWGYDALLANRNYEAARWLRDATRYQPKVSLFWYDLGIAYERLGSRTAAIAAYERAHQLEPGNQDFSRAAAEAK